MNRPLHFVAGVVAVTLVAASAHAFPQIHCTGNACGDVTGNNAVAFNDYLGFVAWQGRVVGIDPGGQGSTGCLDLAPTQDGYIDVYDLLSVDARLMSPPPIDLCNAYAAGAPQNGTAVSLPTSAGFLLLGKAGASGLQQRDLLYALDSAGSPGSFPNAAPDSPVDPSSHPRLASAHHADIRLIQDGEPNGGNVHLLHVTQGLYRVDTGALLLAPSSVSFSGDTVHVGVRTYFDSNDDLVSSPPVLDAAFEPADSSILYVAPVLVQPNGMGDGYRAAAKLLLSGNGTFSVQQLYGMNPASDPCVTGPPPPVCDPSGIREVALDDDGNLFVLAAMAHNDNDWLLVFEVGSGAEQRFLLNAIQPALESPLAMMLTADGSELYLAAGINDPAATTISVYRFSVNRSGGSVTGVTAAGSTQVNGMRHVHALVEVPGATPAQRRVWAFGFTGPTFTQLPFIPEPTPALSDFATAMRADFAPGDASATAVQIAAHASNAVALPLSAIYRPAVLLGDTNCDGDVDFFDIDPFLLALFNPPGYGLAHPTCDIRSADCNSDVSVDFFDIDPFLAILFAP